MCKARKIKMERTFNFGKIDYYGRGRKINLVEVEVKLSNDGVFTASATIWNSKHTDCVCGGQCLDEVAKYVKSDKFKKIYRLWKQYHLNDMHAGTEKQEEALKAAGSDTAISANIFLFITTLAFFNPFINWLYVNPFILAAAFILAIHNFLKLDFLSFLPTYAYAPDFITACLAILNL